MALVDGLTSGGVALQVVLEASGCFVWAYDLLVRRVGRDHVHVAAPSKVRVIAEAGEKTDATDAWWLAYLQYEGRLPTAFVAEGDLRELRVVCREYRSVVDERSGLMRRLRSHLAQLGLKLGKSDFKSVEGRARVSEMAQRVRADHGQRGSAIARLWTRIVALDEEAAYWNQQRAALAKRFDEVKLLDTELAGVGEQLASIVYSELGDPRRYRSAKAYAKATGLTPGYRESAGRRSKQSITREGSSHVRWALTRAVVSCLRCKQGAGVWVKTWVGHKKKRKATKAAFVAAARKLAEAVWRLFALGEAFDLARAFGAPSGWGNPGTPGSPGPRPRRAPAGG
jgi:transposase